MSFRCEINYILKLGRDPGLDEAALTVGKKFQFTKPEHRIYPVDAPIDLANQDWEIIARVAVRQFCVGGGCISGSVEVLSLYDSNTRRAITEAVAEGERRNGR